MKIIKRGEHPNDDVFRGTCRSCKSEIEAVRSELTEIQYDQREKGELANVNCPLCNAAMWMYPIGTK